MRQGKDSMHYIMIASVVPEVRHRPDGETTNWLILIASYTCAWQRRAAPLPWFTPVPLTYTRECADSVHRGCSGDRTSHSGRSPGTCQRSYTQLPSRC